jgi:hypothetical protein
LIKEFVQPEAIADQILSRASPVGRFVSGQAIPVYGDLKMLP